MHNNFLQLGTLQKLYGCFDNMDWLLEMCNVGVLLNQHTNCYSHNWQSMHTLHISSNHGIICQNKHILPLQCILY